MTSRTGNGINAPPATRPSLRSRPRPFRCFIHAVPSWASVPCRCTTCNSPRSSNAPETRCPHECRVSSTSTPRRLSHLRRVSPRTHPTRVASPSRSHRDAPSPARSIPRALQVLRARIGVTRSTRAMINKMGLFFNLRVHH